jgi:predicted flap endonuclease-1-like 5' DNA nuclease
MELAEETGIAEESILTAVKKMDLMRIDGVGQVYAELLHASGVETVPDLARRNASNLAAKMVEVNEKEEIAEALPSEEEVAGWIGQANDLPRVIEY